MSEEQRRLYLKRELLPHFYMQEEVDVFHVALQRKLRVDLLLRPKEYTDALIAIEVKGHKDWCIPTLTKAIKQSADYVLTTDPSGTPIMACLLYPWMQDDLQPPGTNYSADRVHYYAGMMQMAGAFRVGYVEETFDNFRFIISGNEIWNLQRGWRQQAKYLLGGKRQIGSQRKPVSAFL